MKEVSTAVFSGPFFIINNAHRKKVTAIQFIDLSVLACI